MPNMNLLSHSRSKTKNGSSGGSQPSLSEPYAPTNGVPDPKSTIWQEINNRPANVTGSGKILDNVTGAVIAAADMASSSDGMIGVVKGEWEVAKTILTSVPDIIAALEPLSKIHPFVQVAYYPFKLFCEKEILRRDNDKERKELFDKIKDAMLVLLELKDIRTNDTRLTPDKKPILSRLAHICGEMNIDIDECSKALSAHEERSYFTQLRKASSWNKELSGYANRFTKRREDLLFALNLQTATAVAKIETKMHCIPASPRA
ncbi:hypothetical protein B0H14DRAFT_1045001 [Mycena olivaceomarginata]|nr:hypothetical protein B0H14DRAFT_1045001 [Mycena olivaceomarginata]